MKRVSCNMTRIVGGGAILLGFLLTLNALIGFTPRWLRAESPIPGLHVSEMQMGIALLVLGIVMWALARRLLRAHIQSDSKRGRCYKAIASWAWSIAV